MPKMIKLNSGPQSPVQAFEIPKNNLKQKSFRVSKKPEILVLKELCES